jgi:hypothetical protein
MKTKALGVNVGVVLSFFACSPSSAPDEAVETGWEGPGQPVSNAHPISGDAYLSQVEALGAGSDHVCAVLTGGSVVCWGRNDLGQSGEQSLDTVTTPHAVADVSDAVFVTGNVGASCALLEDRTVRCWGNFTAMDDPGDLAPRAIAGLSNVVQIAMGGGNACAVTSDGSLSCWGQNRLLEFGSEAPATETPFLVELGETVSAVALANGQTCVITDSQDVACWGTQVPGWEIIEHEEGDEYWVEIPPPLEFPEFSGAEQLEIGGFGICARFADGSVTCRVGPPAEDAIDVAVDDVVDVSVGDSQACVVTGSGELHCWGDNRYGQMGNGRLSDVEELEEVDLQPVTGAITRNGFTCARTVSDHVACWGSGATGFGESPQTLLPVAVLAPGSEPVMPQVPLPDDCPAAPVDEEALAETPRADENLELMALAFSDALTADPEIYDRLVRDVGLIRDAAPELSHIGFDSQGDDGKSLLVVPTEDAQERMWSGDYEEWNCLNAQLGIEQRFFSRSFVLLEFSGNFDMARVGELYEALPGIESTEVNGSIGDGPTICLTREGSTFQYVLDDAGGDCPAGCTTHVYTHFTTSSAGELTGGESWDDSEATAPEWAERYVTTEACSP